MKSMNLSQARSRLSELVEHVAVSGQRVVINRRGKPLAQIVPYRGGKKITAYPLRDVAVRIADDFDEPLETSWESLSR